MRHAAFLFLSRGSRKLMWTHSTLTPNVTVMPCNTPEIKAEICRNDPYPLIDVLRFCSRHINWSNYLQTANPVCTWLYPIEFRNHFKALGHRDRPKQICRAKWVDYTEQSCGGEKFSLQYQVLCIPAKLNKSCLGLNFTLIQPCERNTLSDISTSHDFKDNSTL